MQNEPKTNFGHGVAETDDISIGISDDGQRYVIQHDPSGETVELGADGVSAGAIQSQELLLNQYADASAAPAGSGPGIVGMTDDGHLLVEDGK